MKTHFDCISCFLLKEKQPVIAKDIGCEIGRFIFKDMN